MIPLQETIDHLVELNHSPDICHACFDNALCEDCFIGSAIHYLKEYKALLNRPLRDRLIEALKEVHDGKR